MRFISLPGTTPYAEARDLQLELLERRARQEIPDTVLFLEHDPVVTRGRGLQFTGESRPRQMPLAQLPPPVAFAESERGGDLTYHGPGQLVIYPIVQLGGQGFAPLRDVGAYLRKLEGVVASVLGEFGLRPEARSGATGVWVGERKLASIGIAVRKWVSYHGIALNCVNDLGPFHLISPCGFSPEVMESLAGLGVLPNSACWRADLEARFSARFEEAAGIISSPNRPARSADLAALFA